MLFRKCRSFLMNTEKIQFQRHSQMQWYTIYKSIVTLSLFLN